MNVKHLIVGLCLCLFPVSLFSQHVIERSMKKRPEWVGTTMQGYLIVSASANELEYAKQKCLTSIKVQMLESIAQNVEYSTETLIEQITQNQNVETNIAFKQKGKTTVVNLPYLTGISLSKAESSYWELCYDKETQERFYTFSVLYPYPEREYQSLKKDFEKMDGEIVDMVKGCEMRIQRQTNLDEAENDLVKLDLAKEYFFDKARILWVDSVIELYKRFFSNIMVDSELVSDNCYRCHLKNNGVLLSCSVVPRLKSECATDVKCFIDKGVYLVTFSNEDCIEDEHNYIELNFRFSLCNIKHKLYF